MHLFILSNLCAHLFYLYHAPIYYISIMHAPIYSLSIMLYIIHLQINPEVVADQFLSCIDNCCCALDCPQACLAYHARALESYTEACRLLQTANVEPDLEVGLANQRIATSIEEL